MRRSFTGGRRRLLLIISSIVGVALVCSFLLSREVSDGGGGRIRYDPDVPVGAWVRDSERRGKGFSEKTAQGEEVLPPVVGEIKDQPEESKTKIKDQQKAKEERKAASAKCAESYDTTCRTPMIHVRIGAETPKLPPHACFNDIAIFSEADIGRGVLTASIDDVTQEVKEVATFDLSTTDGRLIEWLGSLPPRAILVVVSFGDVAERLSPDARRALGRFGARAAADWRGGSAYALLGQRALETGKAKEILLPLGAASSASSDISDCFEFPLGKLNASMEEKRESVNRVDEQRLAEVLRAQAGAGGRGEGARGVLLGEEWVQCGHTPACHVDLLPMHFYSGANKDDYPRMCVGGRMVFAAGLNEAGRGLNVAVIDSKSRKIVKTGHFDTYEKDSTDLELFLDGLVEGDIVAVVSFDEASSMLSDMAKQIFCELGSSMVHRLKFRASWFFVGQKGIRVFSPFEDLNFPAGNAWATPIDKRICVPPSLSGPSERRADKQNAAKRHFCAKYDRLGDFCEESHLDDAIVPRPLVDSSSSRRADDPVFNIPILVVGGVNLDRLRWTLESLIAQPGINTQLVIVAHNREYKMAGDLALLFHFKPLPINATSKYNDLVLSSISATFSIFPKTTSIIVVESEVAATSDLLLYFSQLLHVLERDESIQLVHAFNYNGFNRTSSSPSTVYRVDASQPPAYIFLLRRSLYERTIGAPEANLTACCSTLHRWSLQLQQPGSAAAATFAALAPDVSRVVVARPDEITLADTGETPVFRESRTFVKSADQKVEGVERLSEKEYEKELRRMEEVSHTVDGASWATCQGGYGSIMKKEEERRQGKPLLIRYSDDRQLTEIVKCVGLYSAIDNRQQFVAGFYRGRIRFQLNGVPVLLSPKRKSVSS